MQVCISNSWNGAMLYYAMGKGSAMGARDLFRSPCYSYLTCVLGLSPSATRPWHGANTKLLLLSLGSRCWHLGGEPRDSSFLLMETYFPRSPSFCCPTFTRFFVDNYQMSGRWLPRLFVDFKKRDRYSLTFSDFLRYFQIFFQMQVVVLFSWFFGPTVFGFLNTYSHVLFDNSLFW